MFKHLEPKFKIESKSIFGWSLQFEFDYLPRIMITFKFGIHITLLFFTVSLAKSLDLNHFAMIDKEYPCEFGISMGMSEIKPKCPDIRISFGFDDFIFRLYPSWKLDSCTTTPVGASVPMQYVFIKEMESGSIPVDIDVRVTRYNAFLLWHVDKRYIHVWFSKGLDVIDAMTLKNAKLNHLKIEWSVTSKKPILDVIKKELMFPTKIMPVSQLAK